MNALRTAPKPVLNPPARLRPAATHRPPAAIQRQTGAPRAARRNPLETGTVGVSRPTS